MARPAKSRRALPLALLGDIVGKCICLFQGLDRTTAGTVQDSPWQRRTQRQCPLRRENTFCILKRNPQIKERKYGHQYSPDHLSAEYHEALCRIGAKLYALAS